uniref:Uncharacterized protein n=1 Tax=Rhizophora mucronata TaxID=61149 RepID=A0A2P2NVV4_RHIMU
MWMTLTENFHCLVYRWYYVVITYFADGSNLLSF